MMVSDEEKRWLVVGIAMNKVAAPVLRDYIKQGMDTHYTNLDIYCSGLTTPCTLKTLTYHHVSADPNLRRLKFQNINNNLQNHGNHRNLYNYNINSSVDLAKLFLPDFLAKFSAFDESLDMSAILRLLGFNNPAPIFPSPKPLISIQISADDVRENVRNMWGHCNVTDWTEVLFSDCFSKLETLVKSLGLTGSMEKTALNQLSDWKTKGCQLCMGHAVDQNLLSLAQQDVKELIKNFKKTEGEQTAIQETLVQLKTEQMEMQSVMRVQVEEHEEPLEALLEWKEQQLNENKEILGKLVSLEKTLTEELLARLQGVEDDLSGVKAHISQTDERVKQLEESVRDGKIKDDRPANSTMGYFKVKTCRSKLAEHYKRTAKVPTSVWSKTSPVDIHQIYTRLSWVKEEQTPAGSSQSELSHYTDVFTANKNGVVPKRILVQGQTGIGKSTFVKKLAVDWAELDDEKTESKEETSQDKGTSSEVEEGTSSEDGGDTSSDEYADTSSEDTLSDEYEDTSSDDENEKQKAALKTFALVLVINLKEASKCPSLIDVVSRCHIFPEEERALVEGLLNYVTKNQEKVLLVFDGYDEYRCGTDSDICEIFRGNKLRNCCVLITTRNSKADDLREFKDVHAEITGFSKKDRKTFMRRMLGGETEAKELRRHLSKKHLTDLTRVPLLLLFFCMLWKKGKLKSFPETKTKLYLDIVQYVLNYNQGKHSPARFRKVEHFKEILAEIGKVALECLLKDDHVFEYDQLSTAILCEEGHVVGLFQVTEYAENLGPAGMVSFIHKSIQEFLAAWYITYKCVPEGSLGGIEEHARTLEDCKALENVFQFICGLSDDGAENVFQHFTRVRISDPTLDLSKTVPDVENETDMPLCDITFKHNRVNSLGDLVYSSFQEVSSKVELLSSCLECTGGIVPVTEQAVGFLRTVNVKELTQVIYSGVYRLYQLNNFNETHSTLCKLIEALDWPDVLPGVTENSEVLAMKDKTFQVLRPHFWSSFSYILCFRTGQFQFYITVLKLHFDDHARLFTKTAADSFPSLLTNLCSGQSSLKFLTSLKCGKCLSGETLKALGTAIRNCKYLNRIEVEDCHDSTCDLLKQVPNPSKCSVEIGYEGNCHLTSAGAEKLASLLPTFIIITLNLDLINCCSPVLDALFTSITHKTLETLALRRINLTVTAAVSLGRSLPQMTSLKSLRLTAAQVGNRSQTADLGALFDGLNKTLPLNQLTFNDFTFKCSLPLTNSFRFFPDLRELYLHGFNVNEHNLCCLLESLRFVPNLMKLEVSGEPVSNPHCCAADVGTVGGFTHKALSVLVLCGISLNPAVAAVLGRSLPGLLTLQELTLSGVHQSILQAEEMKALFGGFSKTLPLSKLTLSGFSVSGCLVPLTNSFRFFPNLRELNLGESSGEINMDENNLCGLLESLRFMPNLKTLKVKGKPMSQEHCCSTEVSTMASITHKSLEKLNLDGISLTPKAATMLARSLPKISSLQELELTGVDGSILQAEEMEALFGGLDKTLPLCKLTFRGFKVQGCLSSLTKNFSFILNLRECRLGLSNMDEHACSLLESLRFIPDLQTLSIQNLACGEASLTLVGRERMMMTGVTLTTTVVTALGRLLPEMTSLAELELTGDNESILPAEEIKALFGGLNKTLPLYKLSFTGYSLRGCLAPITESFRFFPNLWELDLGGFNMDEHDLCGLLKSLNVMPNLETLWVSGEPLSQKHCCTTEVNTTTSITHQTLQELNLNGISLTSAVTATLGQLLPEMPSLQELKLTGVCGSILQAEEMEVLFGGFSKMISLTKLTFGGFSVRGCLAPLTKTFRFFPDLRKLYLGEFNRELDMDEHILFGLLESLRFMPNLKTLSIKGKLLSQAHCCTAEINTTASITHKTLEELKLDGISLSPAVAAVLGRLLPEMVSLQALELTGVDGSIVKADEMEALFGGLNKALPLYNLTFRGFGVRGCLAPLTKSFRFFPNLRELCLEKLNVGEHDVCSLLDNLRFMSNLKKLTVRAEHQGQAARCFTAKLPSFDSFIFRLIRVDRDKLSLDGMSLTPAAAVALGQSLPEMSSLEELEITGVGGSILQAEDMEKVFGGFNKTLPLCKLTFRGFCVTGCLAPLTKSFCFFPNLRELCLEQLNMDEHDVCALLDCLRFVPCLKALNVRAEYQGDARCYTTKSNKGWRLLQRVELNLDGISLTPVAASGLGRSLAEMSSLQELKITGVEGSILQTEEMEALFGGLNKTLPLTKLTFSDFGLTGCLAPLAKSLRFFPNLIYLDLQKLDVSECDLCSLLENLRFIPYLQQLNLSQNPLGHALRFIVPHVINLQNLEDLSILETCHSEEDLNYVRDTIQQARPELTITGSTANKVMR